MDKEYHGNKTLLKYVNKETGKFNEADVYKALIHSSSQMGADKMLVPNDKFTPEQWKETYAKMGLPDADKYELGNNLAEGQKDSGLLEGFKKTAHENGVMPKQAQALFDYMNTQNHENGNHAAQEYQAQSAKEIEGLKTKWGEKYENNVSLAGKGLEQFASPEEIEKLSALGVLDSPLLTDIFQRVGSGLLDDVFDPQTKGTAGSTPDEVQDEINKMYAVDHPFRIKGHPQHAFYQEKMQKMLGQLHGNTVIQSR